MSIDYRNYFFRQGLAENRRKRICSVDGCEKSASNNHNISRSLLKDLAIDNHVYEIFLQPFPKPNVGLKSIGIENSTVFRDLCPFHDNYFYQSIDNKDFDVYAYDNIVKLNHRSLRNEWFRKNVTLGSHKSTLYNREEFNLGTKMMVESVINLPFNFRSIYWYMDRVNEALNGEEEFIYKVFEYPYFEVAASELFTYEPNPYVKRDFHRKVGCFVPFSEIFVYILPRIRDQKTYVVVSSHKNDKFLFDDYISKYVDGTLGKGLSDILLIQAEKWVCSKDFKERFVDNKIDFLDVFNLEMPMNIFDRQTSVNLFF